MKELSKKLERIKDDFIIFMQMHPISKAIHSGVLEESFKISGAEVRELINYWSNQRKPIGNTIRVDEDKTEKKYFWAKDWEELFPTIQDLQSRESEIRNRRLNLQKIYSNDTEERFL